MSQERKNSLTTPAEGALYVGVIGDLINSRRLPGEERRREQIALQALLAGLNERWAGDIRSVFRILQGDQFEALLAPSGAEQVLPEMMWRMEEGLASRVRLGIGLGRIDTELSVDPGLVDGPAFHRARGAIERAERETLPGGVFEGFGSWDAILNGLARLLCEQRQGWSDRQRELVELLEKAESMTQAAEQLKITKQAVSEHARAAGWKAYREGEMALRLAIREACRQPGGLEEERA